MSIFSSHTTTFYHKTPAKLGFRMPGEWEPHVSTWLTWPRPEIGRASCRERVYSGV